jgi:hypothetical protein
MKSIKQIAVTVLLSIGAFGSVVYTACNKDKCKDVNCANGGTCNAGNCVCATGYEGTNCETQSRTKFVKTWAATDTLTGGSFRTSYVGSISAASGADVTQVIIGNTFSDNFFSIGPIKANISADSTINIPSQKPDNNHYVLSGTGVLSGGVLKISYTITNDSTNSTQAYYGVWQ